MTGPAASEGEQVYAPPRAAAEGVAIASMAEYEARYRRSVDSPEEFWGEVAREFERDELPRQVSDCDLAAGRVRWFVGGRLNGAVDAVHRHLESRGDQPAII